MKKISMFRYAALLLAIVFAGSMLAGCSGEGEQLPPIGPDQTAVVVDPQENVTPTAEPEPTQEPAQPEPTQEPEPEPEGPVMLRVMVGRGYDGVYQEGTTLSRVIFPTIFLDDEDAAAFPQLAKTFETFTQERVNIAEDTKDRLADEKRKFMEEETWAGEYFDEAELRVARADSSVVSIVESSSYYAGGVHDMYGDSGYVYNSESGKLLGLEEVVTDRGKLGELICEAVEDRYEDVLFFKGEELKNIISEQTANGMLKWYVDYTGLVAIFNPYELASFADGILTVVIPYDGNETLFDAKLLEMPESYSYSLKQYQRNYYDVGDDGKVDEIILQSTRNEYNDIESFSITVNGNTQVEDTYCLSFDAYLFRVAENDTDILMIIAGAENDYETLYTYRLTAGGVVPCEHYGYGFASVEKSLDDSTSFYCVPCYRPEKIELSNYRDMLGTSGFTGEFELTAEGKLVNLLGHMNYSYEKELVLLKELEVFEGDDFDARKPITLTPGTKIAPLYVTDMDGVVAKTDSGQLVSFYVQTHSWPEKINGVDVPDIFDGIMYAG
ncbi:MAG: DUF3298 domain-containing protein [Lachnospiraceae bacterium]|nr:DUF3298 domain-containing protein [Lachnospiraceae bacterium]